VTASTPDSEARRERTAEPVACPFCASAETVVVSLFGSQLLVSQRRCRACGSYFEALRDDRLIDGSAGR
jgi:transcription elongation factor Elf1